MTRSKVYLGCAVLVAGFSFASFWVGKYLGARNVKPLPETLAQIQQSIMQRAKIVFPEAVKSTSIAASQLPAEFSSLKISSGVNNDVHQVTFADGRTGYTFSMADAEVLSLAGVYYDHQSRIANSGWKTLSGTVSGERFGMWEFENGNFQTQITYTPTRTAVVVSVKTIQK